MPKNRKNHSVRRYCGQCKLTAKRKINCPKCGNPLTKPRSLHQMEVLQKIEAQENIAKLARAEQPSVSE